MAKGITFIGFGEAAMAFAGGGDGDGARGYDLKLDTAATRSAKLADFDRCGVTPCDTAAVALADAGIVLSLVTADQALPAAESAARAATVAADTLWLDMNSVAPETKRAAAAALGHSERYVDVAVMAPVHPAGRAVPLLVSGPHAEAGAAALERLGFTAVSVVGARVGEASAIKMIRSVMVKGIEALSAECVLAADAAGVRDAVIASLDASWPGADWTRRFDYNLDRMMTHGIRRAEEMEQVMLTLTGLGVSPLMAAATMQWQRGIAERRRVVAPGLEGKLAALRPRMAGEAA